MRLKFKIVDVFTSIPFKGNPVAVVFDADNLSIDQMQQIANWMNLSETTFIQSSTIGDYKLRIFSPKSENTFAGHPTIGSAFALLESGAIPAEKDEFYQDCQAGLVRITKENDLLFAQMPYVKVLDTKIAKDEYIDALGCEIPNDPVVIDAGPHWAVASVKELSSLQNIKINADLTCRLSDKSDIMGLVVYCIVPSSGVHVRTFAPIVGALEDPVCGSGNAAVALHIKLSGNMEVFGKQYSGFQGEALGRNGLVKVRYEGENILIGGNAVSVIDGTVSI